MSFSLIKWFAKLLFMTGVTAGSPEGGPCLVVSVKCSVERVERCMLNLPIRTDIFGKVSGRSAKGRVHKDMSAR